VRIVLVVNPRSGADVAPEDLEAELRRHGASVQRLATEEKDRAPEAGPDRIVVAGGDGTLAPAADIAAQAGAELAVVPAGTANDFARAMGLPRDLEEACRLAATGQVVRRVDLGRLRERPFLNVANGGLPYRAAREARGLKGALGSLAYGAGGLRAALRAEPVSCRVTCDGRLLFEGVAWQVTVANTGAFGAGSRVEANPADGLLDAVVIEAGSRARLALHGAGLRRGSVGGRPGVRRGRGARVDLRLVPGGLNVDGELVEGEDATLSVEPGAVALVVG